MRAWLSSRWLRVASGLLCAFALCSSGCDRSSNSAGVAPAPPPGGGSVQSSSTQNSSTPTAATKDNGSSSSTGIGSFPIQAGRYTVLDILTDNKDGALAKSNAEGALTRYPDLKCMVGLWAYNPPAILQALKTLDRLGQVKIVGFDEHPETLQAVSEGQIFGTIVQQPYQFGYRSVEYLAALARKQTVDLPTSKMIFIPHTVVTKDNVQEFQSLVANIKGGKGPDLEAAGPAGDTSKPVRLAFITNSVDPFWQLAGEGVKKANAKFNAVCETQMPSNGTVEEQKRYLETNIANGLQGIAISPIDPTNQGEMIDAACAKMNVICHDSDGPNTNRLFYLGTSNYMAGRAAGKLVKEAIPDGGSVAIFVGKMEVLNAQERSKGLIDELSDKPLPAIYQKLQDAASSK
jgi:ribose transport system substrate-binding protein